MSSSRPGGYLSHYAPSALALDVLVHGKILAENERPTQMIERVVETLSAVEYRFGTSIVDREVFAHDLGYLLDSRCCVMSTPILTNAGRYKGKPLSACTVPPLNLSRDSLAHVRRVVTDMHRSGMGTGFALDGVTDPVDILRALNAIALEGANSGKEDRPVGNIATLSVYHPRILEFIRAKVDADSAGVVWKFNISVDCDEAFFEALETRDSITCFDGLQYPAEQVLEEIVLAAHSCADPGLIFLERMNQDNPTPGVGTYVSTAPCAEVGLAKGETCQFGYINLARFLGEDGRIDEAKLRHAARVMTRALDNALEVSIDNYSEPENKFVMSQKRKIGIGVCGLADLFIKMGIAYDSSEARSLALDLVTLINYESKLCSHELALTRGSCGAMLLDSGNRHLEVPSFIERRYGSLETSYVSTVEWMRLAETIRTTKLLRNVTTLALPPTGRSSLLIDASNSIEPVFSREAYLELHPQLSDAERSLIRTARCIEPKDHLTMAAHVQRGVDESISKTVNLPEDIDRDGVKEIYLSAWRMGLKGISIYREGSKQYQPKRLD